jgi:hypothetical protein
MLTIEVPYDPVILLLGIYPRRMKMYVHRGEGYSLMALREFAQVT